LFLPQEEQITVQKDKYLFIFSWFFLLEKIHLDTIFKNIICFSIKSEICSLSRPIYLTLNNKEKKQLISQSLGLPIPYRTIKTIQTFTLAKKFPQNVHMAHLAIFRKPTT
jgi:hypothetical protein